MPLAKHPAPVPGLQPACPRAGAQDSLRHLCLPAPRPRLPSLRPRPAPASAAAPAGAREAESRRSRGGRRRRSGHVRAAAAAAAGGGGAGRGRCPGSRVPARSGARRAQAGRPRGSRARAPRARGVGEPAAWASCPARRGPISAAAGCHVTGGAAPSRAARGGSAGARREPPRAAGAAAAAAAAQAQAQAQARPAARIPGARRGGRQARGRGAPERSGQSKMAGILAWFWNERFWLPHNVTWADLKSTEEATFPQAEDLYLAFPLAFCIFMVRLLFERFVAKPCAIALNIQANGPQIAQPNAILEKVFTAITKHPDEKRLEGLSKQLDWDVRSIQRWFRQRCNQEKPSTLRKFCESMWRFSFSLYVFTYGVRFLKKTPWLWNTRHCWYNYPYQPLTTDLHYYYILELSFYWSLMFSQFTDIKRKDFGIMFLHHLVAIFLISFSYVNNMARVGTLVLCLHDSADVLLEAAKMANYAKFQKICDLLFVMFAMVFITTRLGIFPLWVLNTTLFESWEIVGPYPSWWVFNLLLLLIQGLNCFWSYLIVKIACKAISKGKAGKWNPLHVSKDDRSDIESSSDEEDSEPPGKNPHTATTTNGTSGTNGYLLTGSCSVDD
uniref:sphingosine N-acyltransferase n=1 Tax=Canis lupus familiaris TaxID=9615 RepID=A0A8C0P2Q8_CANLF